MYNWQSMLGKFEYEKQQIIFHGESTKYLKQPAPSIGNFICDQRFSGGLLEGTIRFQEITEHSACQFILSYQPATSVFLTAGIGYEAMFVVRSFFGSWTYHATGGERSSLTADLDYKISIQVTGSRLTLTVNGVDVLITTLPFILPLNQAGIWCQDIHDIFISDFCVKAERPTSFVVMQFTKPYNELYSEVIQPISEEFGIQSIRADEAYGPGIIVADIARQIAEAKLVVAEITPANPNVYYEVGYAHALNKPTILIAEKGTDLPFDVSPFRVLFYENSIEGKRRVEEGFRKHLAAFQAAPGLTAGSS